MLEILYWHRCTSTVFISIPELLALARIVNMVARTIETAATINPATTSEWIVMLLGRVIAGLPIPFLMMISILRVEFLWRGWMPLLRRARATHSERASERLDSKTTWNTRIVSFTAMGAVHFLFADWFIISPFPLPPEPASSFSTNLAAVSDALCRTGQISQLILNHRIQVFAGTYKAKVLIDAAQYALYMLEVIPIFLGALDSAVGLMCPT
ncbi:hypothetical protein C8J56DRAFT_939460 [Mycena floridula]|nr:hypothetical protein C8J56DRAFT_939460 [Mycena floridula]